MTVKTVDLYIEYLQRRVNELEKSLKEDEEERVLAKEIYPNNSVSNFSRFTEATTLKQVIRDLNVLTPQVYIPSYWGDK